MRLTLLFGCAVFFFYCGGLGSATLTTELVDGWSVSNANGTVTVPAAVPGSVHTDLISAGLLGDPAYRYKEVEYRWVCLDNWTYSISFDSHLSVSELSSTSDLTTLLEFDGIDTIAEISLNGEVLGQTDNMFTRYRFDVSERLNLRGNTLLVSFTSPVPVAHSRANQYPYEVPETQNYNVWVEPSNRNFVRKAGSDFGWDWGPAFVEQGLWGGVRLHSFTGALLSDVTVLQRQPTSESSSGGLPGGLQADGSAVFDVSVLLRGGGRGDGNGGQLRVEIEGGGVAEQHVTINSNGEEQEVALPVTLPSPRLWWPVGYGSQPLYALHISFQPDGCDSADTANGASAPASRGVYAAAVGGAPAPTAADSATGTSGGAAPAPAAAAVAGGGGGESFNRDVCGVQRRVVYVGVRRVELVREPAANGDGTMFYFKVNGVAVFARGANVVPLHSFHSQPLSGRRVGEDLLLSALRANMNMVRVWGGGVYMPDWFYEYCDRVGLLVWQEAMFACGMYPRSEPFLKGVQIELDQQVRRISNHPCLAVYGGNNENEVALTWFPRSQQHRDQYVVDYEALYVDTIRATLRGIDPHTPFVDSSPSNGVASEDPYIKLWGDTGANNMGDVHFYDYASDCMDPATFPRARFVSEFGFQSYPSAAAYRHVTEHEDRSWNSPLLQFRQRHQSGNEQIQAQLARHFKLPPDSNSSSSGSGSNSSSSSATTNANNDNDNNNNTNSTNSANSNTIESTAASEANTNSTNSANIEADFDNYCFLTQLQQALCYQTGVGVWRRGKTAAPGYTMGTLYWQLNNVWDGPSWASLEFGGQWKLLHSFARRFYSPLLLSAVRSEGDNSDQLMVHITSDVPQPVAGSLRSEVWTWGGQRLATQELPSWEVGVQASEVIASLPIGASALPPACTTPTPASSTAKAASQAEGLPPGVPLVGGGSLGGDGGGGVGTGGGGSSALCFVRLLATVSVGGAGGEEGGGADAGGGVATPDQLLTSVFWLSSFLHVELPRPVITLTVTAAVAAASPQQQSPPQQQLHHLLLPTAADKTSSGSSSGSSTQQRTLRSTTNEEEELVSSVVVTLTTDQVAVYVTLEAGAGHTGWFDDNVLPVLLPGEPLQVTYSARLGQRFTVSDFQQGLSVRSLRDTYE